MKHPLALFISTILLAASLPTSSFASSILMNDNFESYAIGGTPTTPNDGNTNAWFATGDLAATIMVGNSPAGTAPNEQLLYLNSSTVSSFGRSFDRQDGTDGPGYEMTFSFKLRVNTLAGSDFNIRLIDSSLTSANNPINIRIASNGSVRALTRTTGPGVGTPINVDNPLSGGVKENVWYQFFFNINLSEQSYELVVSDLNSGTSGTTGPLYFAQNIKTLDQLLFLSSSGTNPGVNWYVDDVHMIAIPEPSTAATLLIGSGVLGGIAFRRLRSRLPANR